MPGGWELVLIVLVLILLFGAKKLPDLARGTGRALRIFKSETRGLMDDDDDKPAADDKPSEEPPRSITSGEQTPPAEQPNQTQRPYSD
ncbi:MAG: twin-arginine translocase TatA/TatE family subunit [Propionibacteriales bacterium]|nr:twin-arginine translocase TatA/TatE family subunit [Propionibacteriales bacterium]